MKTLKFAPHLVQKILSGEKISTWRLFDDKDLTFGDELIFVNKETGEVFGVAFITSLYTKQLGALTDSDWEGHERFASDEEMYATYQRYYGDRVSEDTEVKILSFNFSSHDLMAYLRNANSSLFRFEGLQNYDVPHEAEMIRTWKEQGVVDVSGMRDWWNFIERKTKSGVRMQRVRLVTLPLSDYTEVELEIHKQSASHGDDIRITALTTELAEKIGSPIQDFWLIDDFVALAMQYDSNGKYLGFKATQDVAALLSLRDQLLRNAIPILNFKTESL